MLHSSLHEEPHIRLPPLSCCSRACPVDCTPLLCGECLGGSHWSFLSMGSVTLELKQMEFVDLLFEMYSSSMGRTHDGPPRFRCPELSLTSLLIDLINTPVLKFWGFHPRCLASVEAFRASFCNLQTQRPSASGLSVICGLRHCKTWCNSYSTASKPRQSVSEPFHFMK